MQYPFGSKLKKVQNGCNLAMCEVEHTGRMSCMKVVQIKLEFKENC